MQDALYLLKSSVLTEQANSVLYKMYSLACCLRVLLYMEIIMSQQRKIKRRKRKLGFIFLQPAQGWTSSISNLKRLADWPILKEHVTEETKASRLRANEYIKKMSFIQETKDGQFFYYDEAGLTSALYPSKYEAYKSLEALIKSLEVV